MTMVEGPTQEGTSNIRKLKNEIEEENMPIMTSAF